jgi:hypothetical protein
MVGGDIMGFFKELELKGTTTHKIDRSTMMIIFLFIVSNNDGDLIRHVIKIIKKIKNFFQ